MTDPPEQDSLTSIQCDSHITLITK